LRTESTFQRSIDCKPVRWYCWAIRSWDRFSELRPTYHGCRTLTFALARLSCKLPCKPVMLCDKPLSFVNEAKYLGVCLLSGLKFKASLHYMKCNFFRSFNSVYQKCCRANRETVVLQLVQFFRKPHLLYATECLQLATQLSLSLRLHGSVLCRKYFMLRAVMILLVKCVNVIIVLRLRLLIDEPGSVES